MEMRELECRACGAALSCAPGETRVKCPYCGTEYVLRAKDGESDGLRRIDYQGRGALFTSFVPQGWSARVIDDGKASASMLALMPLGLRLDAPDSSAQMAFYPYAYYKDFQPGGLKKNNTLDASLVRWRHAVPAADYVSERLQEMYGKEIENVRVQPLEDSSGVIAQRAKGFENDAAQALKRPVGMTGGLYAFSFTRGGTVYAGFFATALAMTSMPDEAAAERERAEAAAKEAAKREKAERASQERSQGKGFFSRMMNYRGVLGGPSVSDIMGGNFSGGGFDSAAAKDMLGNIGRGLGDLGSTVLGMATGGMGGALIRYDWGRAFDFALVTAGNDVGLYAPVFMQFAASLRYEPLYFELQEEERRSVEQVQLRGMQQRTQNAINASQRVSQTLSETSNIVMDAWETRSASFDRMQQGYSDAVRGVERYTDSTGRVYEADVKYDHIYKNGDKYAGTVFGGADLGADWEELKKK